MSSECPNIRQLIEFLCDSVILLLLQCTCNSYKPSVLFVGQSTNSGNPDQTPQNGSGSPLFAYRSVF